MFRFLIVDDHALVRSGLRRILEDAFAPATIAEAGDAESALAAIGQQSWDLVLLDLSMPGRSGLDALRDIRAVHPNLPVLVLSMHTEEEFAVRALRTGASGYITKERAPEELIEAVRRLLGGGRWIGESLARRLADERIEGRPATLHDALSPREFEVLRAIASGKTSSEIAQLLSLSVKTVSTYRARILEKLRLANNAELTHYAIRNGLVP